MLEQENGKKAGTASAGVLRATGVIWFMAALVGQMIFVAFIILYYGTRTATGNFAGWNDKETLITGHVPGDDFGNFMFALHVLMAAVITLGGLYQLIPFLRARFLAVHRWNGRLFMLTAYIMALGGIWMTWGRGSHLSDISALSVSLNGVLIVIFASLALRHAMARQIDVHRQWAMRTFMVVNGVWFFRVGLMGWIVIMQGPVGMNATLSGPADIALSFGSYLVPLAGLELYMAAQRSVSGAFKIATSLVVLVLTALMALGIFGATMFLWLPSMY